MSDHIRTTCMRCAVGCGQIHEGVDDGYGIATVRGDMNHPASRGLSCSRGIEETKAPAGKWLQRPMVRERGDLRTTTWDVALSRVTAEFRRALERHHNRVAVLGSGQQTNEAAYALGKLARGGFGTRFYDANTTLCMASAVTAYYDAFGSDAPPPRYEDIPDAQTHVIWGANPAVAHPVMFRWIAESAEAAGSRLIVVDPVETKTAVASDNHVRPTPGTDLALARGILARVIERDGIDEAFISEATTGFDALRESLPDPEAVVATTGIDIATLDLLADALADPTLVYWGMGINQSAQGTASAGALIDLCLATGNLGPGTGPFSLTGQANSMGTRVGSSKGSWPGMRPFSDPDERAVIAEAWDIPVTRLPDDPGPGPVGLVEAVDEGAVEAIWAVATNPAAGLPDAAAARDRLEDAFLVVQDAFHTETTELADVVLPAATWGESSGTAINMERRISRIRPAMDLPSGVRTDLDIITTIGERVVPGLLGNPTPEDMFDEFAALTAGTPADLSGVSYDRLAEVGAVRWPAPDAVSEGGYRYHEDSDWSFATPSGMAHFSTGNHGGVPEPPTESYPLTLTTAREPDGYNTGVRSRDEETPARPRARVAPETLAAHDLAEAEAARLASPRAAVSVRLKPDSAVPAGLVWLPIHHPATNELTLPETDPRSAEPNFKQCAVRLDPADGGHSAAERTRNDSGLSADD